MSAQFEYKPLSRVINPTPVLRDDAGGGERRWSLRRLWRDVTGVSTIEFSLVALPFFILLYGTFEIGFVYWASQELEHAAGNAARLVRTGQVQAGKLDQAQLTAQICGQTAVLVRCTTKLRLDVRSGKALGDITPPAPLNGSGGLKGVAEFTFSPGAANDVVLISTFYDWPPLLSPTGYTLRAATVVRNEPF
jgi:Flp pilus assembly protein TadG